MPAQSVIAYHEAGHAVVARKLGISLVRITMVPIADAKANATTWSAAHAARGASLSTRVAAFENDAKISLAGPNAQQRYRSVKNQERAREEEWCGDIEHAQNSVMSAVYALSGGTLPAEGQATAITLDVVRGERQDGANQFRIGSAGGAELARNRAGRESPLEPPHSLSGGRRRADRGRCSWGCASRALSAARRTGPLCR